MNHEAQLMEPTREVMGLTLLCLVLAVACLAAMVAGVLAMPLFSLDGLLLVAICLTLSAFFGLCFLWLAYEARLWERFKRPHTATAEKQPEQ